MIPISVVFHFDSDTLWPEQRKAAAEGRPLARPAPPKEKLVDQPDGTDFWGIRVESAGNQIEKYPADRRQVTLSVAMTPDGKTISGRSQPAAVKFQVFNFSPSSPYRREIDLARFSDFSKPGEYRVQLIFDSSGHLDSNKEVWDGSFTSPSRLSSDNRPLLRSA